MISLKDIATKCKVSTATVSKALNGHKDISEKTRKKIKEVAEELGYFPNSAARALKTNRSYSLGVLFRDDAGSSLTHEYFSGVLNGFKTKAERLGYDITFINNNNTGENMTYLEHCRYRNFDGVAIVITDYDSPQVIELMNSNIPIVTIDYVHNNCTSVNSDNVNGMKDLVQYAYECGHRKIAYIHGQSYSTVTKDRITSFYRTMESYGLVVPDQYILQGEYLNATKAAECTRQLLTLPDRPTCIIYPDDTALMGGSNAILEMGLSIPGDISIAGYDGAKFYQLIYPKITTIRQNTEEVGKEAARSLIKRIESPKTTLLEQVVIQGTLLKGQSVGRIGS